MGDITIQTAMYAIIAAIVVAIIALICAMVALRRNNTALMKVTGAIGIILALGGGGCGIWLFNLTNTALDHGLYTLETPIAGLADNIANSPVDQSADFDADAEHTNAIVVIYRFTCPDCEGVFRELKSRLDATRYDIYWISSRSTTGRALCDLYGVSEVPSILTFDANGRTSVAIAYESDSAGNPMLDQAAVDVAIRALDESNGRVTATTTDVPTAVVVDETQDETDADEGATTDETSDAVTEGKVDTEGKITDIEEILNDTENEG